MAEVPAPETDMHAVDMKADQPAPFRAPQPGSIPVPVPEHENLHTYVQRARNISIFSIVFTLVCAVCGLTFAWSTRRCASVPMRCYPQCTRPSLTDLARVFAALHFWDMDLKLLWMSGAPF